MKRMHKIIFKYIHWKLPDATLIKRSFIWLALGLISKQGLFPIPIVAISDMCFSARKNLPSLMTLSLHFLTKFINSY